MLKGEKRRNERKTTEVQEPSYRHKSTIFPKPPLCANACTSPASRRGIRRLIGSRNLPSRTSSANSRTFEASGTREHPGDSDRRIQFGHLVWEHRGIAEVSTILHSAK